MSTPADIQKNIQQALITALTNLQQKIIEQQANVKTVRIEESDGSVRLIGESDIPDIPPAKTFKDFIHNVEEWIVENSVPIQPIEYKRQASENWQPMYTPDQRGLMSLAGAIAYKIKEEGAAIAGGEQDAQQQGGGTLNPQMEKTIEELKTEIGEILKSEIEKNL